MKQRFSNQTDNKPITVTVEKLFPYGVFVRLTSGKKGYIRRREMSWEGDIDPRKLAEVGQKLEATILNDTQHAEKIELSRRLTLPDPWFEFTAKFQKEDVIEGSVKDILPHGLYAEIIPGVKGFVPLSQLAPWPLQEPREHFWIGDKIEATITLINNANKHVKLSIRRRMNQQTTVNLIMEQFGSNEIVEPTDEISQSDFSEDDDMENDISGLVDPAIAEQIGSILIVEDGDDLRQSFIEWLRGKGFQVTGACDGAAAIKQTEKHCFGVCFVDLDLPNVDGLTFIKHLRQIKHDSHVIVMSSSEWLAERAQEIEEAGVLTVLFKPLDLDEITNILNRIGHGNGNLHQWQHNLTPIVETTYNSFQNLANMVQRGRSFEQRLKQGLEHVFELTKAEMGIIFYFDPASQAVSVKMKIGRVNLNEEASFSLSESPVKDVLREGMPVFETAVSTTAHARFRKLLDYLPFESCIGLPLGDSINSDYALFLFHRKQHAFNKYRLRDAQSVAALLNVALERHALEQRVQAISSILLSGQLSAGFGHEVNNKISAMEIQLRNLQRMCAGLDEDASRATWQSKLTQAKDAQSAILDTAVDLKKTVHLFHDLSKSKQMPGINVNQVIHHTQLLLQPILSKEKTRITLDLLTDTPLVPGNMMRLQQVFLNIMLNSTQHMTSFRNKERRIHIETTLANPNTDRPLKVSITDTGTGIHQHLWHKIFELGFSTRTDGTGLGLFIARSLVESMGGHIYVEKSFIPIGTTFAVKLPVIQEEKI